MLETSSIQLILLAVAAGLLAIYVLYRSVFLNFQVLKRCGITKGPAPTPFWGNFKEISKLGWIKFYEKLYEQYGPVVGFYVGQGASVMVTDVDMLKQILVKDFDTFMNRPNIPDLLRKKPAPRSLLSARGEQWKRARRTLSPSFSAMKMKMMVPLVKRSCDTLVEKYGEFANSGKSVDVFRVFGQFTMETILATAFGRVINVQRGEADQLTEAASTIFSGARRGQALSGGLITLILSNFPWMVHVMKYLGRRSKQGDAYELLQKTAISLVKARRESSERHHTYKDFLQLMIDASTEEGEPVAAEGSKKLSDEEIVSHSVGFLLAGYETTANTLAFASYLLALNPEVQERLGAEIDEYHQNNTDSLYTAVQELQYLDMVLQESLRLYPPATRTLRSCPKTIKVGDVTIPKGASVHIPIHLFHHLPEYWPDPMTFDPERFTPEEKAKRPQFCHMPFGWGPRSCIGMRFAVMEAKMALIEILKKFKFVQAPDTEVPVKTVQGITLAPMNGIYLRIAERD